MPNYSPNDPSNAVNGNGVLHNGVLFPGALAEGSPADAPVPDEPNSTGEPEAIRFNGSVVGDRAPENRPIGSENVVHETLKGVDVGLGFDYAALERAADHLATTWAEKGLPRHDLEAQEQLEVEQTLENQARQIFGKWIGGVRRRVDGAISNELRHLVTALGKTKAALESYRAAEAELKTLSPRGIPKAQAHTDVVERAVTVNTDAIAGRKLQTQASSTSVEVHDTQLAKRQLSRWFWPLMIALVVAEFIGNAPVFTELFPPNAQVDLQLSEWLDPSAPMTWTTGLGHLAGKLAARPEPAFLTFSVVVFLLFLGHHLGGDLRTWMSVRRRHPAIQPALADHLKRQSRLVALTCGAGALVAITVLFVMRATVEPTAEARYDAAKQHLKEAEAEHEKARLDPNSQDLRLARQAWSTAVEEKKHKANQLEYATSISHMNWPISGLNIVLVLVATVAGFYRHAVIVTAEEQRGYLAAEERQTTEHGMTAVLEIQPQPAPEITLRVSDLRTLLRSRRLEMSEQLAAAHRAHARGVQLINCEPMGDWRSVASRLRCAIPRFRAENARLRNLDPRDIKAFRTPADLDFAEPTYQSNPEVVAQFAAHKTLLNRLDAVCDQLSAGVRLGGRPTSTPEATGQPRTSDGGEI